MRRNGVVGCDYTNEEVRHAHCLNAPQWRSGVRHINTKEVR